ncbi:hypothetical protein HMPREF1049_0407 [Fusobacterium necrophorum subsp. funduliforme ATCC 51357]|nr:hypothetical protein HMPREF1049_0407 [Fusobacterium necrophorum subsp. funduliforme ATCC 51357]
MNLERDFREFRNGFSKIFFYFLRNNIISIRKLLFFEQEKFEM